jgi:hypothetical protein
MYNHVLRQFNPVRFLPIILILSSEVICVLTSCIDLKYA